MSDSVAATSVIALSAEVDNGERIVPGSPERNSLGAIPGVTLARGFTLIELLLVTLTVLIVAALLVPYFLESLHRSRQKRSLADQKAWGTAVMAWITDQEGAAAAGLQVGGTDVDETVNLSAWSGSRDYEEIAAALVPVYLGKMPRQDGWKNLYTYSLELQDPLRAQHIAIIGSGGRDGPPNGPSLDDEIRLGPFDPTDYDHDTWWADGAFLTWPERMSDEIIAGMATRKADVTLERFPVLNAPEVVPVGAEFMVAASLAVEAPSEDVLPSEVILPARKSWEISVVLEAPDFDVVEGGPVRTVLMMPDGPSSEGVFKLRAPVTAEMELSGEPRQIAASFWFENRFLARVSRGVSIGDDEALDATSPKPTASVFVNPFREQADLIVLMANGVLVLSAPELGLSLRPQIIEPLTEEDRRQLRQQYDKLAAVGASRNLGADGPLSATDNARARAVAVRAGRVFWRLAPERFKEAFWDLTARLGHDFDSIQIYTDDPTMPWELMRPSRDGVPERDFVGLEFEVARGLAPEEGGGFGQMPRLVPFEQMLVMRPDYEPPLRGTIREVDGLQRLTVLSPEPVESTYAELARVSGQLPNGILHFAGHGVATRSDEFGTEYSILLDRPVTLAQWLGLLPEPRFRNHPFIFFNACDVGGTHQVFGFAEGWAPAFLDAGAAGYVGTLWPVGDGAAARFAIRFYEILAQEIGSLRGGGRPSQAIREARSLFTEDPDPTYLAYVYYGETDLTIQRRP